MKPARLVVQSLRHHWRSHLGVLLGAVLATAILVGALAVGDSVKFSLRELALSRLGGGRVHLALQGHGRFFRSALADDLARELRAPVAPLVMLRGTAVSEDGSHRAGKVQVVGVDRRFWELGGAVDLLSGAGNEGVVLNEHLARRLQVEPGAEVLLRVDKPSILSRDAPLSTIEDATFVLRVRVAAVARDRDFGRFSLEANQTAPFNAFVPLALLQRETDLPDRANVLLAGAGETTPDITAAATALRKHWQIADAALELVPLSGGRGLELRTDRVFLDEPVGEAALKAQPDGRGVLTWFVNGLRLRNRSTPYSTVTAMEGGPVPAGLLENECVINSWLAEDLGARVGDEITFDYFMLGPRRGLEEKTARFRVVAITPLTGSAADPQLMPDFPGVADSENCRDWKPGIPVDLKRIRDKDEVYWDAHRGTPKAFIRLSAGHRLWDNRFGNLTAVRYGTTRRDEVEVCLRQAVSPAMIGLIFQPVRDQALASGAQSLDLGQYFLAFSFFLIVAALLLAALLFALGVEQRSAEVGTLLAVGIPARAVQRLFLAEGALLAAVAAVVGAPLGVLYTQAVIAALTGIWSGAVAQTALRFHIQPATLVGGASAGFLISLFTIWLVSRRMARLPARELLAPGAGSLGLTPSRPGRLPGLATALATGVAGVGLIAAAMSGGRANAPGFFFGGGALLLICGIAAVRAFLAQLDRRETDALSLSGLGVRNTIRRPGRSLAAVTLLACGAFLVIAVGANRQDPARDAGSRQSGTGGFALYGEATLPVYVDLNTPSGRETFGLDEEELSGVNVVPLRMREGDEASCLNLNRALVPRVLGVDPAVMSSLKSFAFGATQPKTEDPWSLLTAKLPDGAIPTLVDANTAEYSLGKGLGDSIEIPDDRGDVVRLRIVGLFRKSVLQGGIVIGEDAFVRAFPGQAGYRVFLIDAAPERTAEVTSLLGEALEDVGLDLTPTPERLAAFATVENTYLSIFAVLGGLGLALGSIGLGVVVLRNVLERRGELGLMRAVGFSSPSLRWLVFSEHTLLLALGLLVGVAAALIAVAPVLTSPGAQVPWGSLAVTLAAVVISGLVWTAAATLTALRGSLVSALRSE